MLFHSRKKCKKGGAEDVKQEGDVLIVLNLDEYIAAVGNLLAPIQNVSVLFTVFIIF